MPLIGSDACCRAGAQKLLGVLITIGEAVAYVVSGMYGDVRELGAGNAILIIVQVRSAHARGVSVIHKVTDRPRQDSCARIFRSWVLGVHYVRVMC